MGRGGGQQIGLPARECIAAKLEGLREVPIGQSTCRLALPCMLWSLLHAPALAAGVSRTAKGQAPAVTARAAAGKPKAGKAGQVLPGLP